MRSGASFAHFASDAGMCVAYPWRGIRDFRTMTPSSRRSTAMSRGSHSILRKPGFSSTAAALPTILRLPKYWSFADLYLSIFIDRLSLLEKGPDAFVEIVRAAAEHLIAILHRNRSLERTCIDADVEAFLGKPEADRRRHHHRFDIGLCGGLKAAVLDDLRDEADVKRALGADEATGEDQFRSDGNARQARQEITGADVAAAETELDEGAIHPCGFRRNPDIGRERQREAAAGGRALDQCDDRLRTAPHQHHDVGDPPLRMQGLRDAGRLLLPGMARHRLLEVEARAEILARTL